MAVSMAREEEMRLEEKLTNPATVASIVRLIDRLDEINYLLDAFIGVLRRGPEIADAVNEVIETLRTSVRENAGAFNETSETVTSIVNTKVAMDTLIVGSKVIRAMSQAWDDIKTAPPQRVGVMGFMRAIGDPTIQPAFGYLLAYAKRFAEEFGQRA